ncbi:glycosyltransferase [Methanobrevibacter sp.]|uniref:glycosyltransferase n=1 Tax=Methanobrevibacter sp. TaxID=66852 RepID=UPI0026E005AF|nr:glycosyltransferase [Methanobrevibacter sp.]MDO5824631.1 glycosyltransferase [Methanobrevibacter sp.]
MTKLSVILPVYNVENYLKRCLESIVNQTLNDIEIICINDGSTDNSLKILEDFAKEDKRIQILSQENKGQGIARNRGLDIAKGEYLIFIDSDDYIPQYALEKLYENATNNDSDMVMFKLADFVDEDHLNYSKPRFNLDDVFKNVDFSDFTFTFKEIKHYVLNSSFIPCKLYKKRFLDKFDDFRFPERLIFEDVPFHVKSLTRASKISFVPEFLYNYRLSNPTSTINKNLKREDIFKICDIVESYLINENYFEELKKEFYEFKTTQILQYLLTYNSQSYYSIAKSEISKINLDLVSNSNSKKSLLLLNSENLNECKLRIYEFNVRNLENKHNMLNEKNTILSNENEKLKEKNAILSSENKELKEKNAILLNKNKKLNKINNEIMSSNSWKITESLRKLRRVFHKHDNKE